MAEGHLTAVLYCLSARAGIACGAMHAAGELLGEGGAHVNGKA